MISFQAKLQASMEANTQASEKEQVESEKAKAKISPPPKKPKEKEKPKEPEMNLEYLQVLKDMGFSEKVCKAALLKVKSTDKKDSIINEAVELCMSLVTEPEF